MRAVDKVVIIGRDVAAWLAANTIIRALSHTGVTVEVVELPSLLSAHDVYASLPSLEAFHNLLGFEEDEVLQAAGGTYSLGQSFANFSRSRPAFFHGYGGHGTTIGRQPFFQFWIKARQAGLKVDFEDFSLNAAAAKQGRFFVPDDKINAFTKCDYAYHLSAQSYVQFLKAHALRRGVTTRTGRIFEARKDDAGYVTALAFSDGTEVVGDLFVDASGPESLMLGGAMAVATDSWRRWFACNRTLTASADPLRSIPVYSQVRAITSGCLHLTPTQALTGLVYAFDSRVSKDDEALQTAAVVSGLRLRPGALVADLAPGRRAHAWEKNVIGVGDAACIFDPVDNVGLHALQQSLAHLITLFPLDTHAPYERDEYNRNTQSAFERLRDFQIAHYKLNRYVDSPYWDSLRDMAVPDTLAWKIELFRARGIVPLYDDETFENDSWLASFLGHGVMPESYDPLVDQSNDEAVISAFQGVLGFIKEQVQAMSSHDAYLEIHAAQNTMSVRP